MTSMQNYPEPVEELCPVSWPITLARKEPLGNHAEQIQSPITVMLMGNLGVVALDVTTSCDIIRQRAFP